MILKRASFDDIVRAGAEYHPPSRPAEPPLTVANTSINDSPDDFVVLDDAVLTVPVGVAWRGFWLADAIQYMGGGSAWKTANWLPGNYDAEHDTIEIDDARLTDDNTCNTPLFYVDCTVGSYNFGHFMHDTMQYGLLFQRVRQMLPGIAPVMAALKFVHQEQLFDVVFDFPYRACARFAVERPMRIDRLVVPRRQTNLEEPPWRLSFAGVRHIREVAIKQWSRDERCHGAAIRPSRRPGEWRSRLGLARSPLPAAQVGTASAAIEKPPLKVHLHRIQDVDALRQTGNLQGRNFANIAELVPLLLRKGYVAYEPSLMPLEYLVRSLSQADVVVAIHGAGLANFVFAPSGTQVYEITGQDGTWRSLAALSTVLGHEFIELRQPPPPDPQTPYLDIEMLEALP